MADGDLRLRHEIAQARSDAFDIVHAVVDEVHLAAALQLAQDRVAHQAVVHLRHVGLDREPLLRRRLHRRHIADAAERHVQRAGDGRGREGEHIHLSPHLLQPLFMRHPEPLLLVDDDES